MLNIIPRDGGNKFSGTVFLSGANGAMQGSNYTDELQGRRAAVAAGAEEGLRLQPDGRRAHHPRQAVVLPHLPRGGGREHDSRHVLQQERRRSDEVAGRLRHLAPGVRRQRDAKRHRPAHVAGLDRATSSASATPSSTTGRTRKAAAPRRGRPKRRDCGSTRPATSRQATWTSPFTNRLLFEAGWGNYLSRYANTAPRIDGSHNDALISVIEQCSAGCPTNGGIPDLIYRFNQPLQQGFERHQIGTLAQMRASASYIPGSHNMKVGYQGNVSHPSQGYFNFTPFIQYRFNNGIPNQLNQTAVYPGTVELPAQHPDDVVLRAGHLHAQPPDAPGRRALRRHRHQLSGHGRRRSRLPADADAASSSRRGRPTRSTGRTSRRAWAPRTTCSATARPRSSSTSAST